MQKTHKLKAAAALTALTLILVLMISPVTAFASARSSRMATTKAYKVGANEMFGINKTDSGYSGIAFDYLNAISRYTGDRYIYVDGTEEELFRKLKNGEIDLIPCVTEYERAYYEKLCGGANSNLFKTTGNSLISRFSAVYVYDKGEYGDTVMNDVSAIRHMNIGYLDSDKQEYFEDGKCIYSEIEGAEFIPYSKEDTMQGDFISGKIDAVMKDCLRPWSDETIVYQFPARSGYFVTRTDSEEFASKLESGLTSLFMDSPTFYGNVYERYVTNYGSRKFAYNAEQSDYIKSHSEIRVAYNLKYDTMHSYDKKSGTLSGVTGSLMEKLSENTGLNVVITPCGDLTECLSMLDNGDVDMVYGGIRSTDSFGQQNIYVTSPAINFPLVLMSRNGTDISDAMKISVNNSDIEAVASLEAFYPNANIVLAEDTREACEFAVSGSCNAVCLSGYDAMYFKNNGFSRLEMAKVLPINSTECFGLRAEDKELCGITENALVRINSSEVIANIYNMFEAGDTSSNQSPHLWLLIATFASFTVIIAGIIVLIVLRNKHTYETDPLTGGYSRKTFIDRSLRAIKKSGTTKWLLIIFDIEKFKFINDRLGYEAGDRMLERIYKTLGDHMENGESYARISDDNFACCIREVADDDVINRMQSIFDEFKRRNSLFVSYPVLFSAGVCRLAECIEEDGLAVDMNIAIDRCKIARKTIKGLHSSAVAFYDDKIRDKTLREKDFESLMPAALEKHEFMCYMQPKFGAKSRRIEGGEALIRWRSSEFGFIYPDEFIPLSEKNGFVVELDFFILEEVCKAMRRWLDMGLTPVVVSVNQSRMHLSHDDYIWRLREIVDKYAIPYEYIELELTETVFTENADLLLSIMQKLHDIGFKLSIDDFGSGYSSLNMLKDIPADVVKIDREFFNGTVHSDKGREVIMTVVDLAKRLKMHVISEGVETLDQVEFLDKINCDLIQGYYFAKPMPMSEFEALWFSELQNNGVTISANPKVTAPSK